MKHPAPTPPQLLPPPTALKGRQHLPTPSPPFTATTLLSSSPKNGQITEEQKTKIEEKLLSGQYGTLKEMATDINDGVPSKAIDEIIFNNMMKLMLKKLNE